MPMTELVAAVRHNDLAVVQRLCGLGADLNERCAVEPAVQRRHESPLYSTTPLFEAVRQRNKEVAAALLAQAEIDPNQTATELQLTPFCDAVSRGDLEMSAFLLRDARVDASLGSRVAAHPALYAAMAGNLDMLALFASHPAKLLPADDAALEEMLYATAAANGQKAALEFVQNYYIDSRPLGKLTPGRQLVKIRREFNKIDADGNGFCDEGEVRELFRALGLPLSDEECREAFMTLNTAGDNRVDLDELTSYWLGPDDFRKALEELEAVGGYGGFRLQDAV
jgi:hypothetical protein